MIKEVTKGKFRVATICALLMFALLAVPVFGGGTTERPARRIKIGLSMAALTQFLVVMTDESIATAKRLDVDLQVVNSEGKIEKQISDLEDFVSRKVDAIIVNAIDTIALNDTVDMIANAKIPLVEVNTMTTNGRFNCYAGSEEVQAGRMQGEYVRKRLGGDHAEGKIIILEGIIGHAAQVGRNKGFYESLINYPGAKIEVLAEVPVEGWSTEIAMHKMEDYLRAFPKIDAVLSVGDIMSLGAVKAVEEAGRLNEIIICGVDAMPDALNYIKDGKMGCSIFQDAKGQGRSAVEAAVKIIKGEKVDKLIYVPFELVTIENVDKYIGRNE